MATWYQQYVRQRRISNPADYQVDAFIDHLTETELQSNHTLRGAFQLTISEIVLNIEPTELVETLVSFRYLFSTEQLLNSRLNI